jgi:outer membrane receptor protein involved in Fe transport
LAVNWQRGPVNIDGSLRYDIASPAGRYAGSEGTAAYDVNGDGVIETPEQSVPIVNNRASQPVGYMVRYLSYSAGANYLLNANLALFARVSEGGRANAERMLFGGGIRTDGSIAEQVAVDSVKQVEGGIKWRSNFASLFATYFHATTKVTDQDITSITERFVSRTYVADGLEFEGLYERSGFRLRGGLTYTLARIAADQITRVDIGLQSSPRFFYQITPAYHQGSLDVGLTFIGISPFPNAGGFTEPGYVQTNAFVKLLLCKGLTLSVAGNNLFNRIGITEIDGGGAGAAAAAGVNTARSIDGRTFVASLVYAFQ